MLFDKVIFGPIRSRRLGVSLGINLLPTDNKLCNFNCIYCECGWNEAGVKPRFNSREEVAAGLEDALRRMDEKPDVITFSGNGEPTMHPDFEQIIDDVIAIRDGLSPQSKIAVLSNATMIGRDSVVRALKKIDRNILKLDSAIDSRAKQIDKPNGSYAVVDVVANMKKFEGRMVLQTMFLRGEHNGLSVDNTSIEEVDAWLEVVKEIAPQQVMIYTIDRETPEKNLEKVSIPELEKIADRVRDLGIDCSVSG